MQKDIKKGFKESSLGHHGAEDIVVGSSNTSDGIVARSSVEARAAAILVVTLSDVVEGSGVLAGSLVDPGVQETKSGLSFLDADVVQKGNDGTVVAKQDIKS